MNVTDCGFPTSPANGTIILEKSNVTTYGASANQTCDVGYDLNGIITISCTADGNWSASTVICTMKVIVQLLGSSSGLCLTTLGSY